MKFFSPNRFYSSFASLIMLAILSVALVPAHPEPLFAAYQDLANAKLVSMTLDEKIAQTLLVRYPDNGLAELEKYQFAGYVFFAKDFSGQTVSDVQQKLRNLQSAAKVPLLTAVDEEGGIVNRASLNPYLTDAPFPSSQALYNAGGFPAIAADTTEKSQFLSNLGLNLNLAPVVDVSISPNDYMYNRTLGQNTALTAEYAKTVITASKSGSVSYTLKHFPGYGNNLDTHKYTSVDQRSLTDLIKNDLPPFRAGLDAGAEAVLVSHNIVSSIDAENPASLSPKVHQLLRDAMQFTGVIITDDLIMAAASSAVRPTVQALLAGNDLIITTDYVRSINEIKTALNSGELTESQLDRAVTRVLAWKYAKGLITD